MTEKQPLVRTLINDETDNEGRAQSENKSYTGKFISLRL